MDAPNIQLERLYNALREKGICVTQGSDLVSLLVAKFKVTTNNAQEIIIENISNDSPSEQKTLSLEEAIEYFK